MTQKQTVFEFFKFLKTFGPLTLKEAEERFVKSNPGFNMGNYNFYRNQAIKEEVWTPSDAKPSKTKTPKDPFKDLKSAFKRDKSKLQNMNDDGIVKWFDEFDPEGEIGRDIFSKILKSETGVAFVHPIDKR